MLKKILIGIAGVVVVVAVISWQAAVAIHARTSDFNSCGNLSTLLDLLAPDTGKKAKAAYDKGDYETARKLYLMRAQHGNSDAIQPLAVMYAQGKGGPVDNVQAVRRFRLLADRGDPAGQFGMGFSYATDSVVEQDYPEALRWYRNRPARVRSERGRIWQSCIEWAGRQRRSNRSPKSGSYWPPKTAKKNRIALRGALTPDENALAEKRANEWRPNK